MLIRKLLPALIVISYTFTLLAGEQADDGGRLDGIALLLSARDGFQGLTSYRCRVRVNQTTEYQLTYSGANYRIEEISDGKNVSLRTFDGETYSLLSLKNFFMHRGTRGPCAVPMTESPLNICYRLNDVSLDHYHSRDFLDQHQSYVVGSEDSDFRGLPCLKLDLIYRGNRPASEWISKDYFGFPVASEEYASDGTVIRRQEVRDHEVIEIDNRKIIFPIHIHVQRIIPVAKLPEAFRNQAVAAQTSDLAVDRATLEINPVIPLSEFQINPSLAKMILNTDTGETLIPNGDILSSDLQTVVAKAASSPAIAVPPNTPAVLPQSPPSAPKSHSRSWIILINGLLILGAAVVMGYKRWRS